MTDIEELLAAEATRQQPTQRPAFTELVRLRRNRDRRNGFVTGVAVAVAAGVLGGAVLWNRQPAPTVVGDGVVVTGTLLLIGGRLGTEPHGLAGTVHFQAADGTVTDGAAASDGRFSIAVSPGQYLVTGDPSVTASPTPHVVAGSSSGAVTQRSPDTLPPSLPGALPPSVPGLVPQSSPASSSSVVVGGSRCRASRPVDVPTTGLSDVQVLCQRR